MSEANKALTQRWTEEIWNKGNLATVEDLVAADVIFHMGSDPDLKGHAGLRDFAGALRAAFPDGRFTNEEQIAEGDKVVQRWSFKGTHKGEFFGVPATGKPVSFTGTTTLRIAGGKVVEHWAHWDVLGWLRQVGRMPL
jgi:steroid delta-isomerase-like uncharacterized protein